MNEVEQKLTAARTRLILDKPFLGALVLRLPLIEAKGNWCTSSATDAKSLYYNANYFKPLSFSQVQFVLAHEALHCGLSHFARRQNRDLHRWNLACDYAVNLMLTEDGLEPAPGALLDEAYIGLSAEEIYPLIPRNSEEDTIDKHLYDDPNGVSFDPDQSSGSEHNPDQQPNQNQNQNQNPNQNQNQDPNPNQDPDQRPNDASSPDPRQNNSSDNQQNRQSNKGEQQSSSKKRALPNNQQDTQTNLEQQQQQQQQQQQPNFKQRLNRFLEKILNGDEKKNNTTEPSTQQTDDGSQQTTEQEIKTDAAKMDSEQGTKDAKTETGNQQSSEPNNRQDGNQSADQISYQPPPPLSQQEREKLNTQWQQRLAGAAQQASIAGKMNGSVARLVERLLGSTVPWRTVLSRFMSASSREDYNLMRPSQRREGDAILPSLYSRQANITVAIDTSGSIEREELAEFITEVNAIKSLVNARITLLACDAELDENAPWVFEPWEQLQLPESLQGGGRTDFSPVFQWMETSRTQSDLIIYFTDARGRFPDKQLPIETLWLVKGKAPVPWGQRIQLN